MQHRKSKKEMQVVSETIFFLKGSSWKHLRGKEKLIKLSQGTEKGLEKSKRQPGGEIFNREQDVRDRQINDSACNLHSSQKEPKGNLKGTPKVQFKNTFLQ